MRDEVKNIPRLRLTEAMTIDRLYTCLKKVEYYVIFLWFDSKYIKVSDKECMLDCTLT